jgi:uncharacterized protein (TIRG00374 family)
MKYQVTWKTFALLFVGLGAFFVYIYIFNVDLLEIIDKVKDINFHFYILAAAVAVLDTSFFTMAWHSLLRFLSVRISLFKSFLFVWVGIFIDTIIPVESVSGEITRIYLVNREQNGTAGKATASIVAQRLIGMCINVATLLAGAVLLLADGLLTGMISILILFLVTMTFIFLFLVLLLCVRENWTLRIVNAIIHFGEMITRGRWKLDKLRQEVVETTKGFHIAVKEYVHAPKTLFVASSFSAISWILALSILYLTFVSVGYYQISWGAILVASAVFIAIKSVPAGIPFEVGLPEITLTTLFILFGVPPEISATVTILSRLLTLWMRFFIGFAAEQWIGIKTITTKNVDHANSV